MTRLTPSVQPVARDLRGASSTRPLTRVSLTAVVVVVSLFLSGCVSMFLPQQPARTSVPSAEEVPSALEPYYTQVLRWENCGQNLQCTTAVAPLDWDAPGEGDDVELALVRQPARSGDPVGSLLTNPGGPGGSGYDLVADSVDFATDEKLQDAFDVVGFDPRGVGRSSAVACLDPAQMDEHLYGLAENPRGTDAWIAEVEVSAAEFGAACAEKSGPLLAEVDTLSAARDLDMLRAALGDEKLYYLGYSYGTYLGAHYAELFPERVGRMVLDGAIDPSASNFEVTKTQAMGFESALRAYLEDCLTGPECPFTGSVEDAQLMIRALLWAVELSPLRATDGRMLGASTLLTAIIYPLYQAEAWPVLSDMFASVLAGDAGTAFVLADAYNGRNADGTYADNSSEAFTAINCLDYSYETDIAVMRAQAEEIAAVAPVIGPYMSFGDISCGNWPYTTPYERGVLTAEGAPPILVIGTTNDPATPYRWAEALAAQLDSGVLLSYEGEGHTAYNKSNDCVNGAVDAYLIEGTVPQDGLRC